MLPAGPQAMRTGAEESEARVVVLHKQGGLFRIIVQNLHEKVSDRFGTRGAGILTPASVGKEFLFGDVPPSPSPVRSLRPGPGDHRRRGRPDRDAPSPPPARRHRPPDGSRQLTDAEADLYNTMQVRQARAYIVHRPALRASLPSAPEPSPGPHLLLAAELRAPLPADPAHTPGNRPGADSGSPIPAAPAETASINHRRRSPTMEV
jgi:hypothetical protein